MWRFAAARAAQATALTCLAITMLFVLSRAVWDPAQLLAGPSATPEVIAATRVRLGLDRGLAHQYATFAAGAWHGDFGSSYLDGQPALPTVLQAALSSLRILVPASLLPLAVGGVLGLVAARPHDKIGRVLISLALIVQSVPFFALALLLTLLLADQWQLLPAGGDNGWTSSVLPVTVLAAPRVAGFARLVQAQSQDVRRQLYHDAARAQGYGRWRMAALVEVPASMKVLAPWIGLHTIFLIGELVIVEPVFNYPGIGQLLFNASTRGDLPLVQAAVTVVMVTTFLINASAEAVVLLIEPRSTRSTT